MNSFELIEKYLPQAVDKYFAEDSKTAILEQGSKFIDVNFNETGYVKIASFLMDGLSDYYQTQMGTNGGSNYAAYAGNTGTDYRDGFAIGGTSITWEIFKLQWVRGKQFRIDYIANEETASITIGNAVEEFNRLKVIPEVDACRFSFIADQTSVSLGNKVNETLTASTILGKLNDSFEWLSEHEVPAEDQIIFHTPVITKYLRNSSDLTKFITQGDYRAENGLTFTVEKLEGRPLIEVPSNRFFTNILLTNNGYRANTTSKALNYIVMSKKAVVPIRKLEWNKVYGPDQVGLVGYHGYMIDYLLYHGVVVPKNKVAGIYVSYDSSVAATTKVSLLNVDTREGSVTNAFVLNNYFSNPAGLRGTIIYIGYDSAGSGVAKDGFVLGTTYDPDDYTTIALGGSVVEATATKGQFALIDDSHTAIAVANQVDLEKKS